jgi:hypothetical protein
MFQAQMTLERHQRLQNPDCFDPLPTKPKPAGNISEVYEEQKQQVWAVDKDK